MALEEGRFFIGSMTDKRFEADGLAEYCRRFLSSGVWALDTNLQVTPGGGMTVIIGYGAALVDGYPYRIRDNGTGQLILTLENADGTNPRIDRVVIRKDPATLRISAYIKTGTPSTEPEAASMERMDEIYEISLARLSVAAGATEITAEDVTDERDDADVCGMISSTIGGEQDEIVAAAVSACKEALYPIGSLYYNAADNTNPETLLGFGTWIAFGAGRVPVGFASGDPTFGTIGATPGEKTHIILSTEMPAHAHTMNSHGHGNNFSIGGGRHFHKLYWPSTPKYISLSGSNGGGAYQSSGYSTGYSSTGVYDESLIAAAETADGWNSDHVHTLGGGVSNAQSSMQNAGGGNAHNNIQPSIVVYIWKRTA